MTVWITLEASGETRFVTLFPDKAVMGQANIELYQRVALTRDLPEHNLCKGDVAVMVEHLPGTLASGGGKAMPLKCSAPSERPLQWSWSLTGPRGCLRHAAVDA